MNHVDVDVIDVDVDDVEGPVGHRRELIIEDIVGMDNGNLDIIKNPFRTSDDEEDLSGHKESSVDADEEYPFAKEDYPTIMKPCSDDSASPRSSSGRSDSTVPLDSSLVLRSSELSKNSMPRNAKLPQIFGKNTSTSFDNPAYGLADFQDMHNLVIRPEQMTDLTLLIGEQTLNKVNGQINNNKSIVEISTDKKISTTPHKKKKRQSAKISGSDAEELLRIGSTDELLGVELSSMPRIRKKKQHSSSGYSTLRSDASTEFDSVDHTSFLVVGGNKSYREVAVDCPPDFIPVTKSHPVYPPPSKTNTLESKSRVADETSKSKDKRTENNNDVITIGTHDDMLEAELRRPAADRKVRPRSRIRSFFDERLLLAFKPRQQQQNNDRYTLALACTTNTISTSTQHNNKCFSTTTATITAPSTTHIATICRAGAKKLKDQVLTKSLESLIVDDGFKFAAYDNPGLDLSTQVHDEDIYSDIREIKTFTTFLGDGTVTYDNRDAHIYDEVDFQKPSATTEIDDDKTLFTEKNQNSRNSLRELKVLFTPKKRESVDYQILEDSPNTQNENNSRLSLEYRQSRRSQRSYVSRRFLSKSDLDVSGSSLITNWSLSRFHTSRSDTKITSVTSCDMRNVYFKKSASDKLLDDVAIIDDGLLHELTDVTDHRPVVVKEERKVRKDNNGHKVN